MPIKKLSPLLANQIAAGEVVERPASVVKELLENAVDAGANRIQVDVERGGARLIRVTDNGHGIDREELELALSRHATSKIEQTQDLKAIHTLGFRGEALASISSVAKLTLSSKAHSKNDSESGWSAIAEGQDMAVELQPRPMPKGTIVEVRDLFFNTPARQKFLRAERTEYVHIEETVKRIALASPEVAFTLKHNGKVTKRIVAAQSQEQQKKRIGSIVSNHFLADALYLDAKIDGLHFWGWLSSPERHQNSNLNQYVFVNARPVRDRTLNHAIRQGYNDLLPTGRVPAFALYVDIDPEQVDVNVHPTKHEVRFSNARMVHDFIAKSVAERLAPQSQVLEASELQQVEEVKGRYEPSAVNRKQSYADEYYHPRLAAGVMADNQSDIHQTDTGRRRNYQSKPQQLYRAKPKISSDQYIIIEQRFLMQESESGVLILDLKSYWLDYLASLLKSEWQQGDIKRKPLLIPHRLGIPEDSLSHQQIELWADLGFDLNVTGPQSLAMRRIPSCVEHLDIKGWLQSNVYNFVQKKPDIETVRASLIDSMQDYWQPESKVSWLEVLNNKQWRQSVFCQQISSQELASWLASRASK